MHARMHACSHECEHNIAHIKTLSMHAAVYRLNLIARVGAQAFANCVRMNADPKPFTVQPMLSLQGGHLKKPIILKCDYFDNTPFIVVKRSDRSLQNTLGRASKKHNWSPLGTCQVFDKMQELRNDVVEKMIRDKMVCDDPLADSADFTIESSKQRHRLFLDCKTPEIIEIEMPEFVTAAGKHVSSKSIKIISTWSKRVAACMEASGTNLDWLILACQHEGFQSEKPASPSKRKAIEDEVDLPELPEPLKYCVTDDGVVKIYMYVVKIEDGKKRWYRKEKKLDAETLQDDTIEDNKQLILAAANKMLKLYQKCHTTENADDDESSDAGCDDG